MTFKDSGFRFQLEAFGFGLQRMGFDRPEAFGLGVREEDPHHKDVPRPWTPPWLEAHTTKRSRKRPETKCLKASHGVKNAAYQYSTDLMDGRH